MTPEVESGSFLICDTVISHIDRKAELEVMSVSGK